MGGARIARVTTGSPYRCCTSDGALLVAGDEAASLQLWDVNVMSASGPSVGGMGLTPAPDGLYQPWSWAEGEERGKAVVNGIAVAGGRQGAAEGMHMALALDDGSVVLLCF
jgi:hypothetical protein